MRCFDQYYDTANWIAKSLIELLLKSEWHSMLAPESLVFYGSEWRSVERDDIKKAYRDRTIRLVVAADAACALVIVQKRP